MRGASRLFLIVGALMLLGAGAAPASMPLDLRSVNWRSVALPGAVCDGTKPIQLHGGGGLVTPVPRRWAKDTFYGAHRGVSVNAALAPVVYGDIDGSGDADAGLDVECDNGGGTADGALQYGWVIFSGHHGGTLSSVGVITPRVQPAGQLPTLLTIVIKPGKVVAHEAFYGKKDATCCASGRATTVWTYANRTLTPGKPVITKQP